METAITITVQLMLCVVFTGLTYWGITDADDKAISQANTASDNTEVRQD